MELMNGEMIVFAVIWPLHIYHQKHPINLILLALFTISLSFTVGVSCAMTEGLYLFPFHINCFLSMNFVSALVTISFFFVCLRVLSGRIVLQALILTLSVVGSLTAYTFWAAKKGKDFSFLGPILFTSLIILVVTSFIQVRLFLKIHPNSTHTLKRKSF